MLLSTTYLYLQTYFNTHYFKLDCHSILYKIHIYFLCLFTSTDAENCAQECDAGDESAQDDRLGSKVVRIKKGHGTEKRTKEDKETESPLSWRKCKVGG